MNLCHFEIHLRSDAEPASGLGGELLNSMLPRDEANRISVPAAHLKGLMRENLYNLLVPFRKDAAEIRDYLFGRAGADGDGGTPGVLHLTGAAADDNASVLTITRTRLENGHAEDQSLRSTEAVAIGTVLRGVMSCDSADPMVEKMGRLALLSVLAIGGNRTRGAGACRITVVEHPEETPGKLLKELAAFELPQRQTPLRYYVETGSVGGATRALKLQLVMDSPLCLPERPFGENNVISSGFVIPGTALAGTLLTLLSGEDPELASACFRAETFRCYPLLPVDEPERCLLPVFVSNTHKVSKCPVSDTTGVEELKKHLFGDLMIPDRFLEEDYRWEEKTANISMKGSDGVLLIRSDHRVELLKAGEIPRIYTAHGVVNGAGEKKDNLFTMESVCVKKFSGLVILPETAAERLLTILKDGRQVFFGKAKSTMGNGTLSAEEWSMYPRMETEFPQVHLLKDRLFIVQTPIVYEDSPKKSSKEILNRVLQDAGWGEAEDDSVMTGVLFGWNRLGLGSQIDRSGRLKAKRVIRPGSVFLLKEPLSNLSEKLAAGLGVDRYAGYGAVIPHPMFATSLCRMEADDKEKTLPEKVRSGNSDPVYCGYRLDALCGTKLSASQIARVLRCAQIGLKSVEEFLDIQRETRPARIWAQWEKVFQQLKNYLKEYKKDEVIEMIRVWHDLRSGRDAQHVAAIGDLDDVWPDRSGRDVQ